MPVTGSNVNKVLFTADVDFEQAAFVHQVYKGDVEGPALYKLSENILWNKETATN